VSPPRGGRNYDVTLRDHHTERRATHDPNHALGAADRAYLMRDGTRLVEGPVRDVPTRTHLGALYGAPVGELRERNGGRAAFLPG
jgi:iron complex transport system ATP-binding protein